MSITKSKFRNGIGLRKLGGIEVPKELHRKLAKKAREKGLTGERKDAYVYGTMNKIEKKLRRKKQ